MELGGERCRSSDPPFSTMPTSLLHPLMRAEDPVPAGCTPDPCPSRPHPAPAASHAASPGTAEQHRGTVAARAPIAGSGMLCRTTRQYLLPLLLVARRKTCCVAAPRKGCSVASTCECGGARDFYCSLTRYKPFVELHIRKIEFVLSSHGIRLANVNNCVFPYLWKYLNGQIQLLLEILLRHRDQREPRIGFSLKGGGQWPALLVSLRMLKPALSHPAPLLLVFSSEEGVENISVCPMKM